VNLSAVFFGKFGSVKNLISFNYSLNFFHRYRIAGVSVVSKGQDRLAGNIQQNISEFASTAGVSRRRNPLKRLYKYILYDFP
jgi:hypothetical protein